MNKITRKSFLKVLAATMVGGAAASALTGAAAPVSIDETNGKVSRWVKNSLNPDGPLTIAKQGMFSSGGTVTAKGGHNGAGIGGGQYVPARNITVTGGFVGVFRRGNKPSVLPRDSKTSGATTKMARRMPSRKTLKREEPPV